MRIKTHRKGYLALLSIMLLGVPVGIKVQKDIEDSSAISIPKKQVIASDHLKVVNMFLTNDWAKYFLSEEDSDLLLCLASYKGGDAESRAYNIRVVLNRLRDENHPVTIADIVENEMPCGIWFTDKWKEDIISNEALGLVKAGWDKTNGSLDFIMEVPASQQSPVSDGVKATKSEAKVKAVKQKTTKWKLTNKEKKLLARIAMTEAQGEGVKGKALVINVVLNRVKSSEFPDNIHDVIYQKNQFEPTTQSKWYDLNPDAECYKALRWVLEEDWDQSKGALYFEATSNGSDTWHTRNLTYLFTYKGHNFYK